MPDPAKESRRQRILLVGDLPSPINPPSGCVFHTRCPKYRELLTDDEKEHCRTEEPLAEEKTPGHIAACHYPEARADIAAAEDLGLVADEAVLLAHSGSEHASPLGEHAAPAVAPHTAHEGEHRIGADASADGVDPSAPAPANPGPDPTHKPGRSI